MPVLKLRVPGDAQIQFRPAYSLTHQEYGPRRRTRASKTKSRVAGSGAGAAPGVPGGAGQQREMPQNALLPPAVERVPEAVRHNP